MKLPIKFIIHYPEVEDMPLAEASLGYAKYVQKKTKVPFIIEIINGKGRLGYVTLPPESIYTYVADLSSDMTGVTMGEALITPVYEDESDE